MEASAFTLFTLFTFSDWIGKRQIRHHPIAAGRLLARLQGIRPLSPGLTAHLASVTF